MSALTNQQPITVINGAGASERVFLRKLSIRQLYTFIDCISSSRTIDLIAMCVEKPTKWVEDLPLESFKVLAKAATAANFQKAVELAECDPAAAAKLGPIMLPLQRMARELFAATGSDSSPEPAPSESAPATGSASSNTPLSASSPSSPPAADSTPSTTAG